MVAVEPGADERLELLTAVLDPVPALTPALLELTRWAAAETASAWGEAAFRALPPGARSGAPPTLPPLPPGCRPGSAELLTGAAREERIERRIAETLAAGGLRPRPRAGDRAGSGVGPRLEARLHERAALVTSAATPRARWAAWWACRTGTTRLAVGTRTAAWLASRRSASRSWSTRRIRPTSRRTRPAGTRATSSRSASGGTAARASSRAPPRASRAGWPPALARSRADPGPRGAWPTVERVALGADEAATASLSPGLRDAARAAIARGRSVLLVLNRLGYARTLACAECGAVRRCGRCRLALLYHRETRTLACRLCGHRVPAASLCGRCRGRRLQLLGWGTERLEAEARQAFPEAQVVRYDSTVAPDAAAAARTAFQSGAARVLVGTTMALRLAEETPVAVAALVLADATLTLPDFRAASGRSSWRGGWGDSRGRGSLGSSRSCRTIPRSGGRRGGA